MARPARAGLLGAFRSRRTTLRAVVARMLEAEAPALSPGECNLPPGRSSRGTGVGDHGGDEAVDLVRLLDLPHLPVPGGVDVGGGVQDMGGEDAVSLMGERACVDGLVELRPRLAHRRRALVERGDREPAGRQDLGRAAKKAGS
jgi:hypothetical protein